MTTFISTKKEQITSKSTAVSVKEAKKGGSTMRKPSLQATIEKSPRQIAQFQRMNNFLNSSTLSYAGSRNLVQRMPNGKSEIMEAVDVPEGGQHILSGEQLERDIVVRNVSGCVVIKLSVFNDNRLERILIIHADGTSTTTGAILSLISNIEIMRNNMGSSFRAELVVLKRKDIELDKKHKNSIDKIKEALSSTRYTSDLIEVNKDLDKPTTDINASGTLDDIKLRYAVNEEQELKVDLIAKYEKLCKKIPFSDSKSQSLLPRGIYVNTSVFKSYSLDDMQSQIKKLEKGLKDTKKSNKCTIM